jgi:hypothetical protein
LIVNSGQVAEWLKALDSKSNEGATLPWVQIPPCPPLLKLLLFNVAAQNS